MPHFSHLADKRPDERKKGREMRTFAETLQMIPRRTPENTQNEYVLCVRAQAQLIAESFPRGPEMFTRRLVSGNQFLRGMGFQFVTDIFRDHRWLSSF